VGAATEGPVAVRGQCALGVNSERTDVRCYEVFGEEQGVKSRVVEGVKRFS